MRGSWEEAERQPCPGSLLGVTLLEHLLDDKDSVVAQVLITQNGPEPVDTSGSNLPCGLARRGLGPVL